MGGGGIILKNPANGETMICEVKPLKVKSGQAKKRLTQTMTVWKLMINKHTNVCWWLQELCQCSWLQVVTMTVSAWWRGKTKDLKQNYLLCSCSDFFYMSLYTSLYRAMKTSLLCLRVRHHIKVATELQGWGHLVSCELLMPMQLQT
jgi:hypothetical protein